MNLKSICDSNSLELQKKNIFCSLFLDFHKQN